MSQEPPMKTFDVANDIARAHTLPGWLYGDKATHTRLLERVFARAWLPVPPPPKAAGSVAPLILLPGALDEPLLLTRDAAHTPHCLSNVCTHRGMLLACEAGEAKRLRCRYHGRRFSLDGSLEAAPGFEGAINFPSQSDNLPALPLARWGPLWFTRLSGDLDFDTWTTPLMQYLDHLVDTPMHFDAAGSRDYTVDANWMLYLDNYLEGMHVPTVHPSLATALDVSAYRTELVPMGSIQVGIGTDDTLSLSPRHPLAGEQVAGLYIHLFPNTLINVYPWGISVNHVEPIGPSQTRVRFFRHVSDPDKLGTGAGSDLHQVELEDEAIVEATGRGVRARLYNRGRYAPKHETAVHHFHRWIAPQISGP